MRLDLSDLDRLRGFAAALERLFWCLMAVGFFTAVLGSAGTGFFVLVLGAISFVVRAGLEDFVRSRDEAPAATKRRTSRERVRKGPVPRKPAPAYEPERAPKPEFTVYRTSRRPRRTKSAV